MCCCNPTKLTRSCSTNWANGSLMNNNEWCRREDLNPQPTDYKSVALPVELHRLNIMFEILWWRMTGSNRRPPACKAGALPAELILRSTGCASACVATGRREFSIPSFCITFYCNLAMSYSHRRKPPTTIGAEELNFRVRHGNGCDLFAIITR